MTNMFLQETNKIAQNIEGALGTKEGALLYDLAKLSYLPIVEIGSWKGRSTFYLASGSNNGNKVMIYAIDPHTGFTKKGYGKEEHLELQDKQPESLREFLKNTEQFNELIMPIVKTSEQAVNEVEEPIEVLFIDGDHSYDAVMKDFKLWFPKVIDGGWVIFHDTTGSFKQVRKVVKKVMWKGRNFRYVNFVDSSTFGQKCSNTRKERLKNKRRFIYKKFYDFIGSLHLPKWVFKIINN